MSLFPAKAQQLVQGLQESRLPLLQELWRNTVLSRCLAAGQRVDGFAELPLCGQVVELLHDWKAGQGVEGSVCDNILRRVKFEIVLDPSLQLLALVGDGLARLGLERGCFDARGAGGSFDPLVHPSGVAPVGGGLDPGAEGLPVLIGAAAGGLLGLASSCFESVASARAGFLLVVQQCFSLGLGDWLHFNPVRLKPVRVSAFFLAESGHG